MLTEIQHKLFHISENYKLMVMKKLYIVWNLNKKKISLKKRSNKEYRPEKIIK